MRIVYDAAGDNDNAHVAVRLVWHYRKICTSGADFGGP